MRIVQPSGQRGSLKWIQHAIANKVASLEEPILIHTGATTVDWRSPIETDQFAEYRDNAFLARLGLERHGPALADFWPARGPQWDALGVTDRGDILLVEAKAHIRELCSPPSQAGHQSRQRISARLTEVAESLRARRGHAPWIDHFYQLGNRLAHLHFLRSQAVDAYLVLVNFTGDKAVNGPTSRAEWEAAYSVAWHVMGLDARHPLAKAVIEVFPSVANLR